MSAIHLVDGSLITTVLSGAFVVLFFVLEWPLLIFAARALVVVAVGLSVLFWQTERISFADLAGGLDRAAFLAFFVVALGVLRVASQSSNLVRTCGRILVSQSPTRRYVTLTLGGYLMGILMSFGAINLLGTMIKRAVHDGPQGADEKDRQIKLQRMSLALLRGFCAVPLCAPTSVTIAIVLSSSLTLKWTDLVPYGAVATLIYLGLGWGLDRVMFSQPNMQTESLAGRPVLRPFVTLSGIVFLVPVTGGLLARQLDIDLIGGLMIAIPFIAVGWIFIQMWHLGVVKATLLTGRRIVSRMLPSFCETRNEITIFAASGYLGVVLLPQIDVEYLGALIAQFGLGEGLVLVAASWTIIMLAILSVNPLMTAILAIETIVALPGLNFAHEVVALMITATWAIVVAVSPFSASLRLLARCIGHSPSEVGLGWNLMFIICAVLLLDLTLLVVG